MTSIEFHTCHFCGEYVREGLDSQSNRHWLSDCRPDLVKHEPGPLCTWASFESRHFRCYAYHNNETGKWDLEHIHFYEDGPL